MCKIVIVGSTLYGHNLAVELRKKDESLDIILISEENYLPYDRKKFPELLTNSIREEELFLCKEDFYKEKNINFLKGKEVVNINTTKKLIYFKDKDKLEYDLLVIAVDKVPKLPPIPGIRKKEVYNFYFLEEVKRFLKQFVLEPVCVVGSDELALRMAEAVVRRYKIEVKLVSTVLLAKEVIPCNVELLNSSLSQIIGEGEVQAIKLKEGKIIAVCAVIFMDNYKANIEFLKDTDIKLQDDFILVDEQMQTNIEDIFAIGSVANRTDPLDISILANYLINQIKQGVRNVK